MKQYWLRDRIYEGEQNHNNANIESQINPLPKDSIFKGVIRFDNLTERELGLLLWALKLEKDSEMNIGKGKPYGYGVITISDVRAKTLNLCVAYAYDSLSIDPFMLVDVDALIERYKKKMGFNEKDRVPQSVNTFLAMKDGGRKPDSKKIRYMSVGSNGNEYQKRRNKPLPQIQEVLDDQTTVNRFHRNEQNHKQTKEELVRINKIVPDKEDSSLYVGHIDPKGMVFKIPKKDSVKPGDEVWVKITNVEKKYGNYMRKNGD